MPLIVCTVVASLLIRLCICLFIAAYIFLLMCFCVHLFIYNNFDTVVSFLDGPATERD